MVLNRINQSLIKDIAHDTSCPMRFKLYYLDKAHKNKATTAMVRGQYFEYHTLGSLAQDGSTPYLELKKNGEMAVSHIRINKQIEAFNKMIVDQGITILDTDLKLEAEITLLDGRIVTVYGTIDAVFEMILDKEIIDTKLTGDITNTFSSFGWGNWEIMDKLQAHMYGYLYKENTGEELDFTFHVYDYKPVPEYNEFRVPYDEANFESLRHRVDETINRIDEMEAVNFAPQGSEDECKKCLATDCPTRIIKANVTQHIT
jgi:hypothetical protein